MKRIFFPQVGRFALGSLAAMLVAVGCGRSRPADHELAKAAPVVAHVKSASSLDFNQGIAPIVFEYCTPCHRPGESAPFSLLSYQDVKQHALQIAEVVESGYMPPWLPEPIADGFQGERRLSTLDIETITKWARGQQHEGDPGTLPALPKFPEGWQLGEPDLIVEMPEAYTLSADGPDVFRNFVLPVPITETHFVRAVEIRPENKRIVHHAELRVDQTSSSRDLDDEDAETGFDGMQDKTAAERPDGHFLGWTPGKVPRPGVDGYAWRLPPAADLVLLMHMLPSGKPEAMKARIGLFFADSPPTHQPYVIRIGPKDIDVPAGESEYVAEDQYALPVSVDLLAVYPHAHYLGKHMQAWAELPNGNRKDLIEIRDWDFNWQDAYQYRTPIALPAGSVLRMRYVYDNSADNDRNPNNPPRRVIYGPLSSDEMGDLWMQVEASNAADREALAADHGVFRANAMLMRYEFRARARPDDPRAHMDLGSVVARRGDLERARQLFRRAVELGPDDPEAHNQLGGVLARQGQLDEALVHFRRAQTLDPNDPSVLINLGTAMQRKGDLAQAAVQFQKAIERRPKHGLAHKNLGILFGLNSDLRQAEHHYELAVRFRPQDADAMARFADVLIKQRKWESAETQLRRAIQLTANDPALHRQLGRAFAAQNQLSTAVASLQTALGLDENDAEAHELLANVHLLQGDPRSAVTHFSRSVKLDADRLNALNSLAWILATSPDDKLRDGKTAVRLAERCARATGHQAPETLDTLAAAYAEAGQFDQAVRWQTRATELATEAEKAGYRARLEVYQSGKPYREGN